MNHIFKSTLLASFVLLASACNLLDRDPLDSIPPQDYYKTAEEIQSFSIRLYGHFPNVKGAWHAGVATWDNGTDNQAGLNPNRREFSRDNWKVAEGGGLGFDDIRNINYFLADVDAKLKAGKVSGAQEASNKSKIDQALGETYFFRAYLYFNKLKTYGDFPIITEALPEEEKVLQEHAKRQPRNEVARFILQDLDKAISLLSESTPMNQRITKRVANLFKSRVALYEATFEKYHAGSGRVPGDANWPGKDKEWNKGKTFDQAAEVSFFLDQAISSAKVVADAVELTPNNGVMNPTTSYNNWNPYYELFASTNPSSMSEALLWRQFSSDLGFVHHTSQRLSEGSTSGWTRSLVESFLTQDGKPYYAVASTRSDSTIKAVKAGRDQRLQLFIFGEDDALLMNSAGVVTDKFEQASLLEGNEIKDITGYRQRKCYNYNPAMRANSQVDQTAIIIFRAAEAYLNYIEASYLKNNSLTTEARAYWEKLRKRAGIQENTIDATISATDMAIEAKVDRPSYDWGAFSEAKAVDATLYSIRRERRCEFAGEGYRWDDLVRWRAMDQVKDYQIEGINFWTKIYTYKYFQPKPDDKGVLKDRVIANGAKDANLSSKELSMYLRPYQVIKENNNMWDGYTFYQAHYLSPFSYQELLLCSPTKDAKNSNLYQNPGWKADANTQSEY